MGQSVFLLVSNSWRSFRGIQLNTRLCGLQEMLCPADVSSASYPWAVFASHGWRGPWEALHQQGVLISLLFATSLMRVSKASCCSFAWRDWEWAAVGECGDNWPVPLSVSFTARFPRCSVQCLLVKLRAHLFFFVVGVFGWPQMQARRVYEILRLYHTDMSNEAARKAYRLMVKQRLNRPFQVNFVFAKIYSVGQAFSSV